MGTDITNLGSTLTIQLPEAGPWTVLTWLLLLTVGYQIVAIRLTGHTSDYAHLFFFSAGIMLLSPAFFSLLVLASHLSKWGSQYWRGAGPQDERFMQVGRVIAHIMAGVAAYGVQGLFAVWLDRSLGPHTLLIAGSAIVIYVAIHRLLLFHVFVWVQGLSWRSVSLWKPRSLVLECVVMVLGFVLVLLWRQNVWLLAPALAPLVLITQIVRIPQLEKAAQTDAKTGLLNVSRWRQRFHEELIRAKYFKHPLCLIMVDLDGLRTINNTHGHLAGDAVIAGVARILQEQVREYTIVGRFGGEEFALILPETATEQAQVVAERLRRAIEMARFSLPTSSIPLQATACFGVATFPDSGDSVDQLIHQADVALYQAKVRGKNCVVTAGDLPLAVDLKSDSASSTYQAAFTLSGQRTSLAQHNR